MKDSLSISREDIISGVVSRVMEDPSLRGILQESLRDSVLLTARQAARIMGICEAHFRTLPIDTVEIGDRARRYPLSAIRRYQENRSIKRQKP